MPELVKKVESDSKREAKDAYKQQQELYFKQKG